MRFTKSFNIQTLIRQAAGHLIYSYVSADSVPASSSWIAAITTVIFLTTAAVATLLTVSTSSLVASGAISRPSSYMISEPSRNVLVRMPLPSMI